jgi:hypothetical protein
MELYVTTIKQPLATQERVATHLLRTTDLDNLQSSQTQLKRISRDNRFLFVSTLVRYSHDNISGKEFIGTKMYDYFCSF